MKSVLKALAAIVTVAAAFAACAQSNQAEKITWPSIVCGGNPYVCKPLAAQGELFRQPGQTKIVLISHGSQGVDARMYDYVRHLQGSGFAALVIDHWKPRGIDTTHNDYVSAGVKGGNETNIAFDDITAADWARRNGFTKVGTLGESQGGQAQIVTNSKWAYTHVDRNMSRLYGTPFVSRPMDAVVSMYGFCGFRNANRDAYTGNPFLFITGEVDDETPSKYCEALVPYMNEKGGNASIVVLPGEGHSFDAPFKRRRELFNPHYAKCDVRVEKEYAINVNTGEKTMGHDTTELFSKCKSTIFHTGYWKDRDVAVPTWLGFFQKHLGDNS